MDNELIDRIEEVYAEPDHPVHQLVPPEFAVLARTIEARLNLQPFPDFEFSEGWPRYEMMREDYVALRVEMTSEHINAVEHLMDLAAKRQWHHYEEARPHLELETNHFGNREVPGGSFSAMAINPQNIRVFMSAEELALAREQDMIARNLPIPGNRPLLVYIGEDEEEAGDGF